MGELLARVRAVLRRAQFTTGELAPAGQSHMILGELSIDFGQRLVTMAGRKVVFTPTEYRILASLAHSVGQIVPQEQLLEHAWGTAYVGEDHLLQVKNNRLGRKLESDPAHSRYILTEPGVGYVLATPPQV